jgi:hypothetical protein
MNIRNGVKITQSDKMSVDLITNDQCSLKPSIPMDNRQEPKTIKTCLKYYRNKICEISFKQATDQKNGCCRALNCASILYFENKQKLPKKYPPELQEG